MESFTKGNRRRSAPSRTSVTPSHETTGIRRGRSLAIGLASHRKSQCDFTTVLPTALPAEEAKRPGLDDGKPTDIFFFILFKKIRNVDVMKACVSVRFIISLQWEAPHLKGKKINLKNIWTPKIDFLNNDMLVQQSQDPTFYPERGEVKSITGKSSVCVSLKIKMIVLAVSTMNIFCTIDSESLHIFTVSWNTLFFFLTFFGKHNYR